jgi:hypothetical protein
VEIAHCTSFGSIFGVPALPEPVKSEKCVRDLVKPVWKIKIMANINCKICGMQMQGKVVGVIKGKTRIRELLEKNAELRAERDALKCKLAELAPLVKQINATLDLTVEPLTPLTTDV